MVHYAALPEELIFLNESKEIPPYLEITYRGVKMMVQPMGINSVKIVRLFSTDPQDYLKPDFQPGTNITI